MPPFIYFLTLTYYKCISQGKCLYM